MDKLTLRRAEPSEFLCLIPGGAGTQGLGSGVSAQSPDSTLLAPTPSGNVLQRNLLLSSLSPWLLGGCPLASSARALTKTNSLRGFVLVFYLLFTATLGAVFGVTTCLSAQIREEPDSPLDYFIGGCATGAVLGARAHSYMTGTTACVGLGVTAALFKIGNKEGWRLMGPPKL
uniref:NADH dehydrogenase [ubiquinone] 1 alpha subcomplex subunit 11 n=1 Tax=Bubo bubo TaxID=30461 RepID=A0A8C0EU01_BUBBB